jgi:pyruvate kinase
MINSTYNKTKIVATVGPASETKERLLELMIAGVDIFRLNFSHGTHEGHAQVIKYIRELNARFQFNVGILQDLQGPKIRLRALDAEFIEVNSGEKVVLVYEEGKGTRERLTTTYNLAQDVREGDAILIDDGNIELRCIGIYGMEVHAEVVYGGKLKSKKGINLPNTYVSEPSLTKKDKEDLAFGLEQDVDWIALSFVRTATDIMELRNIIKESGRGAKIISKIETPYALKNIDEIIAVSDALMVARGDLAVEIPMESVPVEQKKMIYKCNKAAKPVIVATQMMESMITNSRPTRAEASDVANAVIDGADAVMLSAESASGKYPIETVQAMEKIISNVERDIKSIYHKHYEEEKNSADFYSSHLISNSCKLAKEIDAKAILSMSKSGYTAFQFSSHRPEANIFVFTKNRKLLTQLSLLWGVRCFYYESNDSADGIFEDTEKILVHGGFLSKGDLYLTTASMPVIENKHTNLVKVGIVEKS